MAAQNGTSTISSHCCRSTASSFALGRPWRRSASPRSMALTTRNSKDVGYRIIENPSEWSSPGGQPGRLVVPFEHIGHLRHALECLSNLFELVDALWRLDVDCVRTGL